MATVEENIVILTAAIMDRITGVSKNSYEIAGRDITNASLDELRQMRKDFQREASEPSGGKKIQRTKVTYTQVTS